MEEAERATIVALVVSLRRAIEIIESREEGIDVLYELSMFRELIDSTREGYKLKLAPT